MRKSYKKLKLQFGVRGENTQSKGSNVYSKETIKRQYFNFFPSGAMLFNFKDNSQFGVTYSTRIVRPSPTFFNPNNIYSSIYATTEGNGNLLIHIMVGEL